MLKNRKAILDIIMKSDRPLSANDIYKKIEGRINRSTVYRSINWLLKEGFVLKTHILNEDYYHPKKEPHKHFKICLKCKEITEIPCTIEVEDFTVVRDEVILYGYCKNCDK